MEVVKHYIRRMSLTVRVGSDDVHRDISMISRDMQLVTSEARDDAIQYVQNQIDVIHYISKMPGYYAFKQTARTCVEDLTMFKLSDMMLGEDTVRLLNRIDRILLVASEDIIAPMPDLLPEFVDVSAIHVYHMAVVSADGVICARMYNERKDVIIAMIEIGTDASITFYPDGGEKVLTVKGDRRFVVFVRI